MQQEPTFARRWAWPLGKALLATAILVAVSRQFYLDLQQLEWQSLNVSPAWLFLSATLYLAGLGFSAAFWVRLLHRFGQQPRLRPATRAYYISHLGKYVPGKAWALLLRGALLRGPDVGMGVAVLTAFYEVLTTMACGALLAAVIFIVQPPSVSGMTWSPLWTGVLLLMLLAVPLLPVVFNRIVGGMAARFRRLEAFREPRMNALILFQGLVLTAGCWLLLGLSVWAMLQAILPQPPPLTLSTWAHLTATIGLAYVAGFLALVIPSGVGVREYFLLRLLEPMGPEALIALAVLLLRLVWTAAELLAAGILWWLPPTRNTTGATLPAETAPGDMHCQATAIPYNGPRTTDDGPSS